MDPPKLESTLKKSKKPRNPYIEFLSFDDWDDIRRVIREQEVPPGTPYLEYKNRIVPLRWDPIPRQTILLSFRTADEAMAHFGEAQGGTSSDAGTTVQSNVSTSCEEHFSLGDTPVNAEGDKSPSGEKARSNLRGNCAEKSAGEEASYDAGSSAESNVSTNSEEYFSPEEDTTANAKKDGSPSGESALSNLRNLGPTLNRSTAHISRKASDDKLAEPVISERLTRCNEVLVNLLKSAERENVQQDDGGHHDIIGESPSLYEKYKAQPERSYDEAEAIRKELSTELNEFNVAVTVQDKKFQKTMNTQIGIFSKCGTAERGSGEEITRNPSARRLIGPGTSMKTALPKIILTRNQKRRMRRQQKRVNRMPHHDLRNQSSPLVVLPYPKNPSDLKDWCKISVAMIEEKVARYTESYFFEGRNVPLGWGPFPLNQFIEGQNSLLASSELLDAKIREKAVTAGASTSEQDKVEQQKPEETRCDYTRGMIAEKLDAERGRNPLIAGTSTSKLDTVEEQSQEEDHRICGHQPSYYQDNSKKYKKKRSRRRNKGYHGDRAKI